MQREDLESLRLGYNSGREAREKGRRMSIAAEETPATGDRGRPS